LTKAFTACILDFEHIGRTNILYGKFDTEKESKNNRSYLFCYQGLLGFVLCILMSYLLRYIGSMACIIFVQMTTFAVSIFMLSWTPNPEQNYAIYLVVVAFCVSQSISNGQIKGTKIKNQ